MSELRIKNRSERDLRSCEVTEAVTKCLSYFTTGKISFASKIVCILHVLFIEFLV